jgi:hypothetical protein
VITGLLALVASTGIAISTFLNPNRRSQDHYNAATGFLGISNKALFLYEVESIMGNKKNECATLLTELFEATKDADELTKKSPRIPPREWNRAKNETSKRFELLRMSVDVENEKKASTHENSVNQ